MVVTVSSRDGSLSETALADYITRNIQNPVSRVPGVGKFQLFASGRAMRVWVDPDKLTGFKLSMGDVNNAIGRQTVLISGGIMGRSEEHTSELQSLMRISYDVFVLKNKSNTHVTQTQIQTIIN